MLTYRTVFALASVCVPALLLAQEPHASLDGGAGRYALDGPGGRWRFEGKTPSSVRAVRRSEGRDSIGRYREIAFEWDAPTPVRSSIRTYDDPSVALFSLKYLQEAPRPVEFPKFTTFPTDLYTLSHRDEQFSPATFSLVDTSTPWLFFDRQARSFVFSPANEFLIAKMVGDGKTSIGESLNKRLSRVPKGLEQKSVMVFGRTITDTWDAWGEALRSLYDRPAATPRSDVLIEKYGYWTDNGADYYYNYDPAKGYAGTILALADRYKRRGLPFGYLQLDSWWYRKLVDSISGDRGAGLKNAKFPAQDWNRYGGILEYRASPDLFPDGLTAFSKKVGVPIAVHSRWIDRESPLRSKYQVSGVAPVDPAYWRDVADYLADSGVTCYEQDWLDHIYAHSPEMSSTVGVADAFADGMAQAMRRKGLTMQYCMATPRFVLQGLQYPNLTTVRTTTDRFVPEKWAQFLFGSQFVYSIGTYPWCDVFRSSERGNMIVATLSAGPVGTGDAVGREDRSNMLRCARPDGVVVKPDRPMVPTDLTYLNEAEKTGRPFVASTFTDHDGFKTQYVFGFPRTTGLRDYDLRGGVKLPKRCYVFDLVSRRGRMANATRPQTVKIGSAAYAYTMIAPIGPGGVTLLGDLGKFVPTGKQRIAKIEPTANGLRIEVSFAAGEESVTLDGYCPVEPRVRATTGHASLVRYNRKAKRFAVAVTPSHGTAILEIAAK